MIAGVVSSLDADEPPVIFRMLNLIKGEYLAARRLAFRAEQMLDEPPRRGPRASRWPSRRPRRSSSAGSRRSCCSVSVRIAAVEELIEAALARHELTPAVARACRCP
jgi:hypothetical protein